MKATVLVLLLFLLSDQQLFSEEDSHIQWKFEPRTDRSVHVEAVVTLMESTESYTFLEWPKFLEMPQKIWIKNVKAYEYESGIPIEHEVYYNSKIRKQVIALIFSQPTPEPFVFGIEFDLADFMEEREEKVFIFKWWYNPDEEELCTGMILLPEGTELLDLQHLEPVRMEEGAQVTIYYEGKLGYYNDFRVQLAFSSSGKDYVGLAERYEEAGDYDSALSYYQKAKSLYGQYNYFAITKPEFFKGLYEKIFSIQKVKADKAFTEAAEAFEQEEYEKAKTQFEKAETQYRALEDIEGESQCKEMILKCQAEILLEQGKKQYEAGDHTEAKESFIQAKDIFEELGNTEKVSECEEMITEYERLGRVNEAEMLLEQGKTQYGFKDYTGAKESFIQTKDIFEELEDTEKVSECKEWLDNVEEVYRIILISIFGAVAIFLAWWQRFH